jgi:hypothetical protein
MLLLFALAQSVIAATAFAPVLLASHVLSAVKTLHSESEPQHAQSLNVPPGYVFKLLSAAHSVYCLLLIHISVGEISLPPHKHTLNCLAVGSATGQSAIALTALLAISLLTPQVSASWPLPLVC